MAKFGQELQCANAACGKTFNAVNLNQKYCCVDCFKFAHSVEMVCEQCGKTVRVPEHKTRRPIRFCSRQCWGIAKTGKKLPRVKGRQAKRVGRTKEQDRAYQLDYSRKTRMSKPAVVSDMALSTRTMGEAPVEKILRNWNNIEIADWRVR